MSSRLEALRHRHVLTLPTWPAAARTARQTPSRLRPRACRTTYEVSDLGN